MAEVGGGRRGKGGSWGQVGDRSRGVVVAWGDDWGWAEGLWRGSRGRGVRAAMGGRLLAGGLAGGRAG